MYLFSIKSIRHLQQHVLVLELEQDHPHNRRFGRYGQGDGLHARQQGGQGLKGVVYALRCVLPAIKKTVGNEGPTGSVVVNSSCMGLAVIGPKSAGSGMYSASKAFVNSLVETAAIENAPRIRINSVMPGVVQTEIMPIDSEAYNNFGAAMQPLWGRAGQPEEVASLVAYLIAMRPPSSRVQTSKLTAFGACRVDQ